MLLGGGKDGGKLARNMLQLSVGTLCHCRDCIRCSLGSKTDLN